MEIEGITLRLFGGVATKNSAAASAPIAR